MQDSEEQSSFPETYRLGRGSNSFFPFVPRPQGNKHDGAPLVCVSPSSGLKLSNVGDFLQNIGTSSAFCVTTLGAVATVL